MYVYFSSNFQDNLDADAHEDHNKLQTGVFGQVCFFPQEFFFLVKLSLCIFLSNYNTPMFVSFRVTKPIGVLEPEVKLLSQNKNMIGQLQVLVPKNLMMMTVSDWIGANLLPSNQWKIQTMNSNWNGNYPKKKLCA